MRAWSPTRTRPATDGLAPGAITDKGHRQIESFSSPGRIERDGLRRELTVTGGMGRENITVVIVVVVVDFTLIMMASFLLIL